MSVGSARALAGKLLLDDLAVEGRRVLVRADLNVPVHDDVVTDDTRLVATLPTLRALLESGATPIVMSHRGRPHGVPVAELGMAPVARALRVALGREVALMPGCVGADVAAAVDGLGAGDLALLENLRFNPGETGNDPLFARQLAELADLYVDDAFGAAHRAHASITGVPPLVESAAAGRLLQLEVEMLSRCVDEPVKPFVLVAGGAKVSDKLDAVANLMPLVDRLLIGGAMANSVLASRGVAMGRSRIEEGSLALAAELLERAADNGVEVLLPRDFIVAPDIDSPDEARAVERVPDDCMALDIGPQSAEHFAEALADAQTVLWNGPMGVFEVDAFAGGTHRVGAAVAALKGRGGLSIVGGGDTAAATAAAGISSQMGHVSTGGGASLDLLSGVVLPGIAALTDRGGKQGG